MSRFGRHASSLAFLKAEKALRFPHCLLYPPSHSTMYRLVSSRAAFHVPVAAQRVDGIVTYSAGRWLPPPNPAEALKKPPLQLVEILPFSLAGTAYWMTRSTEPSLHDVKRDARELKDVTVEKSEALADDVKLFITKSFQVDQFFCRPRISSQAGILACATRSLAPPN
ncbi:hypothetical protein M422DRAFT_245285 [Sphaerobolus stellatus SS14]|nr:hypothetical protein M422DRAFT_245285 [Sphaerobolus stellatus SS14]